MDDDNSIGSGLQEDILRQWEFTFDCIPDLIAILDHEHRIVRINKAFVERLGLPREEIIGSRCCELIDGTALPPEYCPHSASLTDGRDHTVEVSLDRLKGDFLVSVSPLRDSRGNLAGAVYVARDITQRKRVERALRVSNAFLVISHRHDDLTRLIEDFSKEIKAVAQCGAAAICVLGEEGQSAYEVREGFRQPLSVLDDWLFRLLERFTEIPAGKEGEAAPGSVIAHGESIFCNQISAMAKAVSTEPGMIREHDPGDIPYESICRVAVRSPDRLLGYFYAADDRKALFSQETIELLENAAMYMGTAMQKVSAQESLKLAHQELEARVEERTQALSVMNRHLKEEILERKKTEDNLRRESAFREAIIANTKEGLCVWRFIEEYPHVAFTVWNRSMREITGYTMEEINRIGWVQAMFEDPAMQAKSLETMKSVCEGRVVSRLERSIRRADGRMRTVLISSSTIQFQGDRTHVIALMQDVTELKEAEHALRQSETQFRGLVENIGVGILILKDGSVLYQNPEQERLLENSLTAPYPLQDLLEAIHPDSRTAFEKLRKSFQPEGQVPSEAVLRLLPAGGEKSAGERWVSCRCSAIEYRGETANLVHMIDITEHRHLECLLLQQEKMASLGHVAAGIAHEIRNPLSGINVYLDAIRDCYQDPECSEDVDMLIREAQNTSNKIESVIRRVLDFSRPTELRMRVTSINEAVREAVKLAVVSLRKTSISLDLDLQPDLQPVYADAQLIEQLLINLIGNATNVLKGRQGERRIRISTRMKNGFVLIRVEDSGPGIPAEIREKIFEPFFTTEKQGMGIGLGICKRITVDHKGEIAVSNSPLGGARFDILIPVEKRRERS